MTKTTWRGLLNHLARNIGGRRAGSVCDRSAHRRSSRRLELERLEDRIALATNITIIGGAAGSGSLDSFLSATQGTITTADDPGDPAATLSTGALVGVNSTTNTSIAADNAITFTDLGGTLTLQTGVGHSAAFSTSTGPITFANVTNTLATSGGALGFTAGTSFTAASLVTNAGLVTNGTDITLIADTMNITQPIDAGISIVTLAPFTSGRGIDAGLGTTAGDLDLSNAALGEITAGTLRIGSSSAGALTVTAALNDPAGATILDLASGAAISQNSGAAITVTELAAQGAGGVSLDQTNAVSTLAGTTANQNFVFTNGGGTLTVGSVDGVLDVNAGTGNVSLTVGTAAVTGILVSQFPNDGVADVTGGTVTLTALGPTNGNTGQIGFFTSAAQFFEVSATTLNASTNNSRLWISAIGGAGVGSINAGTNTAILKTVNGDLTSTHAANSTTPDVTAGTVILRSSDVSGSFGSAATPLEVQTSTLNASVTGAGSINVRNVAAGGNLAVPLASTANGDINLAVAGGDLTTTATTGTDISAPGHTVTLNASGSVTSGTPSGVTDVAAANLAVTAGTAVALNNSDAVTNLAGSAGTSFQFTNTSDLTIGAGVQGVSTANGPINLTVTAGNLTTNDPGGSGTASISAPGNTVTLNTSGAVLSGRNLFTTDIAAASLAVANASAIGRPFTVPVKTAVGAFAANVASGGVFVINTSAALDIGTVNGVNGVTATGGTIDIRTSDDLTVSQAVSTTGAAGLSGGTHSAGSTIDLNAAIDGSSAGVGGGGGDDTFNVTVTGTSTPLSLGGDGGSDTFNIPASVGVPINIDGGRPPIGPLVNPPFPWFPPPPPDIDTLNYDALKAPVGTVSGALRTFGLQTVTYTKIENINLNNAAAVDAFYGPDTADRATFLAGLTPNERFVQALYLNALGRPGAKSEIDAWAATFNLPNTTQPQAQREIAAGIEGSFEGRDHLVKSWYLQYLGRAASSGEELGWVNGLMHGLTEEQTLSDILGDSGHEFYNRAQTLISSGTANERYVRALYALLLNRSAGSSEVAGWVNSIPIIGIQGVALGFLTSLEFRTYEFEGYYNALLHRRDDTAGLMGWAAVTGNPGADTFSTRIDFEMSLEFFNNG